MGIPVVYRRSAEASIQSFDWTDIASGQGYVTFYGASDESAYFLTPNVCYSQKVYTDNGGSSATVDTKQLDIDFDILFNVPQTIYGNAIVNVPIMSINTDAGGTSDQFMYPWVAIRKWDGTTETTIASISGSVVELDELTQYNDTYTTGQTMHCVTVNIATPTRIKKGETLRVTVEVHQWAGRSSRCLLGHDPQNRSVEQTETTADLDTVGFNGKPTVLSCQIPFKVDL